MAYVALPDDPVVAQEEEESRVASQRTSRRSPLIHAMDTSSSPPSPSNGLVTRLSADEYIRGIEEDGEKFTRLSRVYVQVASFWGGLVLLLAYNALLSTSSYLSVYYKLTAYGANVPPSPYKSVWNNMDSIIAFIFMGPNLLAQLLNLVPFFHKIDSHHKMFISLALMDVTMVLIPVIPAFKVNEIGCLTFLFVNTIVCAFATGVYETVFVGTVSSLPPQNLSTCFTGVGLAALITNVLAFVTEVAVDDTLHGTKISGIAYYSTAAGITFIGLLTLAFLPYNAVAQQHVEIYRKRHTKADGRPTIVAIQSTFSPSSHQSLDESTPRETTRLQDFAGQNGGDGNNEKNYNSSNQTVSRPLQESLLATGDEQRAAQSQKDLAPPPATAVDVFYVCWPMVLTIGYNYILSLLLMPSIITAVPVNNQWYVLSSMTVYNGCDTLGRLLTYSRRLWLPQRRYVIMLAGARSVFVPLFFFCADPHWIKTPVVPYILSVLAGVTNGYTGTLSNIYAADYEELRHHESLRHIAGNLCELALLIGCTVGACYGVVATEFM